MNRNIIATIILLLLDFVWIAGYMGPQYQKMIPNIQQESIKPRLGYAILSYLLMVAGLNLFVLPNVKKETAFKDSLTYAFTFGIIVYGIFDFTNAAILANWDLKLALVDIMWGGLVYFLAAYVSTSLVFNYF